MVSVEALNRSFAERMQAQSRSFAERVRLNRQNLQNKYWSLPVLDHEHSEYMPVGRGVRSSVFCGLWRGFLVCKNVRLHKGVHVGNVDCTGKVVVRHRHWWCHKPSCPVCFIHGWAVREAGSIVGRLEEGVRRGFGKAEHITVSVAVVDRDLPESVLREKCRSALVDRGVSGACMIFHGYRQNEEGSGLVWSPHYHVLGFVAGGFDRCRACIHSREDCRSCDGFKGREVRGFAKDGYLVKVHEVRKTVFGSAWYQLHHATVRVGLRRFQSVTWFGNVSYRMFKSSKPLAEVLCPACESEMTRAFYVGKRHFAKDIGAVDYVPMFVDDEFDESGKPNWVEVVGGGGSVG